MRHTLSIIDDLTPDAPAVRQYALECGKFETVHHDGFDYPGIWRWRCPELEKLICKYPGLEEAEFLEAFFRLNREGEKATSWIHADIGMGNYAIVWYLNEQDEGGTAFWRHRALGWDRLPDPPELARSSYSLEQVADLLRGDSNDEQAWDHLVTVPARFNRMIVYPTACFHSRMPKESFGSTKDDARLIYVAFLQM